MAVGFRRLKDLLRELAPAYETRAIVEVLDRGYEKAVAELHGKHREQPIDVLVAAGSNGAYLRQHLDIPVVLVKVGGFDVMRALVRAKSLSSRIALVTYQSAPPEVKRFNDLFGLGLVQRTYRDEDEARACVRELQAGGIEVVVAPGLVADLAAEVGLFDVFLYSQDAVREALDDAVEVARVARIELAKRERLNTVLGQLRDGVVAVDMDERIETLNPAMEHLLGGTREELLGRRLSDVAPELNLRRTLRDARPEVEQIERLGDRTVVVSRIPIVEQGVHTGAVLTCQDPASIQRVDRQLRSQRRLRVASARYGLDQIVGTGAALMHTKAVATSFARSDATVLVLGESGTGKELLAQGIHRASRRARQPFIAVNCAAFPESLLESELFGYEEGAFTGSRRGGKVGLFEAAHTGSIFLDEVGEMPLPLQTRLLRVLQEREVLRIGATEATPIDVRVIAATHRDLQADIVAGSFRRDLYFRLNILRIELPPLRERPDDVPVLADHLLRKIVGPSTPQTPQLRALVAKLVEQTRDYAWPGNVRELENLLERLVVHCDEGGVGDVARTDRLQDIAPELFQRENSEEAKELKRHRARVDVDHILDVLASCDGDRAAACKRLGIGRTTLWRKLREAGLSKTAAWESFASMSEAT